MGNDKKIFKTKEIHSKKLKELGVNFTTKTHDPDKVIVNYSSYNLSDKEKNLLSKGLNFALPPKRLNYGDYLAPYELLFRDIKNLSADDYILERVQARR